MLRALPQAVFGRLRPKLDLIKLSRRDIIYEADAPIQHVYFLDEGLISYVKAMQDGRVVEIGAVGRRDDRLKCDLGDRNRDL